jgi:hypothetical protein
LVFCVETNLATLVEPVVLVAGVLEAVVAHDAGDVLKKIKSLFTPTSKKRIRPSVFTRNANFIAKFFGEIF